MGEGLQEVVIVGFHKKPGDAVKRDELLYSMETDKAVMDVESPYDGVVKEWLATEGQVLQIGAPVARVEAAAGTAEPALASVETLPGSSVLSKVARSESSSRPTDLVIPPRTRALCKELGISDEEMKEIVPAAGNKLMPADVEAFAVARGSNSQLGPNAPSAPIGQERSDPVLVAVPDPVPTSMHSFTELPLSSQQRVFTSRIRRSAALVIPATMTMPVLWEPISNCTRTHRDQDFTFRPTEFQTFAWCVSQASRIHPKLRSTLQGDETVREYAHLNLGVAVGLKSGELVTAVVHEADRLDYHDFVNELQSAIALAREGKDQADAATQVHLTYMGQYGITEATPLLVSPAIAVMFVGAAYPRDGGSWVNLSLTIDHRLINGVEGAQFLRTVVETIDKLDELT
jgi:pyruvate dehydrogenase E2 component (dihydrolipoamide acetyltransferase)